MSNSDSNSEHSSKAKDTEPKDLERSPKAMDSEEGAESRSVAEKVSFLLSAVLLSAVLVATIHLWVRDRNQLPPALEITSRLEQRQGKFYIPFTVVNEGGETVTTVQVVAELRIDGELVEWGDQRIDFLSRKEEAEGAFIFVEDPRVGELTVRVASYTKP